MVNNTRYEDIMMYACAAFAKKILKIYFPESCFDLKLTGPVLSELQRTAYLL